MRAIHCLFLCRIFAQSSSSSYSLSYVRMCVFSFFYATLVPLECELLQCNEIYLIIAISIALFSSISHFSLCGCLLLFSSDFFSWLLQEVINFISVIVSAWGPFSIPFHSFSLLPFSHFDFILFLFCRISSFSSSSILKISYLFLCVCVCMCVNVSFFDTAITLKRIAISFKT